MIGALGEVEVLSFDGPSVGVCVRELGVRIERDVLDFSCS
jgi:hypothetical protein